TGLRGKRGLRGGLFRGRRKGRCFRRRFRGRFGCACDGRKGNHVLRTARPEMQPQERSHSKKDGGDDRKRQRRAAAYVSFETSPSGNGLKVHFSSYNFT